MIFTDVYMPDRTKRHFLLDEEASAEVILTELIGLVQNMGADRGMGARPDAGVQPDAGANSGAQWSLYEDFEDRALIPELSLKAQGIMGGMRLRIKQRGGSKEGDVGCIC